MDFSYDACLKHFIKLFFELILLVHGYRPAWETFWWYTWIDVDVVWLAWEGANPFKYVFVLM